MHAYVKAWADIILHGFLLLPWYIFEWIISGFDSKVICLPVKRYWSMNGKNVNEDGKGIAVPFGILEGAAFVVTALAMFYFNKAACMDTPVAYADASKLLLPMDGAVGAFTNKALVRAYTDYPSYLGSYIDERAKSRYGKLSSEASEFTLLDEDLLKALVSNCGDGTKTYGSTAVKYDEKDINAMTSFNYTSVDVCNFITFTEKCVCAGVYSEQAWVDCVGTSNKVMKDDGASGYVEDTTSSALCVKHGGLNKYLDTKSMSGHMPTNSLYDVHHIALMCALLMSFSRFVARLMFPCELKKPGAMWVNGWPAGLLCLISSMAALDMYTKWELNEGVRYFTDSHYMFGYNSAMVWQTAHPFIDATVSGNWGSFRLFGVLAFGLNVACSFFSDYSYCNDVTTLAYTKANLKRVRERTRKAKLANL